MADEMEQFINGNDRKDANYVAVLGKIALQQKAIDAMEKRVDETRQDFKEAIRDHRDSNERVVEAIKQEVAALSKGFEEMTNNVKRIQYILLGGALFYILDTIGLKQFLIKIMGA